MKKAKILLFTGHKVSDELMKWGRENNAQFRNVNYVEGQEPCDLVAGPVIPAAHSGDKVHPDWEDKFEYLGEAIDGPRTASNELDEVEITLEYLESLSKKQMLELVDDEELEFTNEQKKSAGNLLEALKAHYEV
jgi:hypothetical protein